MLAIQIGLDLVAECRVRAIWQSLDDQGVQSLASVPGTAYRPHVSLAVFEGGDQHDVVAVLAPILRPLFGTPLSLASMGFFVNPEMVAFLGVTPTELLLTVHHRAHSALAGVISGSWQLYQPGSFVPHCTLAMRADDVSTIIAAVKAHALPIAATVHDVRLVEISTGRSLATLD